ncbi:efflux RND transporter periplasmic adaptor subunit [Singulisphaera sp. PoT]|uniref:efflux RND transporter periplasmic adaptor subunit n=1 Tax=Singulisphaera sp. PoT TaxID=3411797 RepID=UPI003BF5CEF9
MTTANLVSESEHKGHRVLVEQPAPARRKARVLPALAVILLGGSSMAGLYYLGITPKREQRASLFAETTKAMESRPRVNVAIPFHRDKPADLTLPADIKPFQETDIFARTDGYLKKYLVDIGDKVEAGALLAEIDTPELDQELKQAQATLLQSKANRDLALSRLDLARITLRRTQMLMARGAETQQVLDQNSAEYKFAEASVATAEADIAAKEASSHRLAELQKFQKIYAPYSGTITARNIYLGDLISVGMARPLFRISQTDRLKVYASVPQANVTHIKTGQTVEVLVREYPNRVFVGKVERTAGAIDTASRTLLTEILLPNPDGALYSGMYVKVRFDDAGGRPLLVPATTLVINTLGTRVAVVDQTESLRYQNVQLGRDYGKEVEILQGLSGNERLILNPTENLAEGVKVEATPMPAAPAQG